MKIKFNSDDELPLNNMIEIPTVTIVAELFFMKINIHKYFQINIYYDRIDNSEGIDVNKTSASKECGVCHYWYFLNYSSKFQSNGCNRCHDLLMMSMNLGNIAILNIKGSDYLCIISLISKNETINLLQNADLIKKSRTL